MTAPHRWTMGVCSDGSAVWLNEWRGEYEYREWLPNYVRPGAWRPDECYTRFRGISNNADREIPRQLARQILAAWRHCRKHKIEEGWRQL